MNIKKAIAEALSFTDEALPKLQAEAEQYEVTIEENIELLNAMSNMQFILSQVKVVDPQPDDLPSEDEGDPLQGEIDSLAKQYRDTSALDILEDNNKSKLIRIAKLFNATSEGSRRVIAVAIANAIEAYWEDK